jgi:glycosyltransferase involved in cell wall biosynthesis
MASRLCMVVHGPYPVGEPRVLRETRVALEHGFEVDVLAMRNEGEPREEAVEGARVLRLPLTHRRGGGAVSVFAEYLGFTALATIRLAYLGIRRRYRIIHVHNPPDFLVTAAIIPRLFGARIIFDVHDLSPDMFAMRFERRPGHGLAQHLLRFVERTATRLSDAVLTVHEPYRRELLSRGVPAEKVTVVMNSLDESLLPTILDPSEEKGFRVVYHGTVTPHYGVDLIVEAAARARAGVPDLRVEVYGAGDSVSDVRSRAVELGMADRLFVSGRYLAHEDVLNRVQGASVGVIPNRPTPLNRYALSSKLFEYVALGIPVVCSDLPTLREHFSEDEVLFFGAGDADALASAILEIAENPEAARERAATARARYEQYRWPVSAGRYADVLGRLA